MVSIWTWVGLLLLVTVLAAFVWTIRARARGASDLRDLADHDREAERVDICLMRVEDDEVSMRVTTLTGAHVFLRWHPNQLYTTSNQMGLMYMQWVREKSGSLALVHEGGGAS